jgi:hypothetical protein
MAKASTAVRITSFAAQTRFIAITLTVLALVGSAYADAIFRLGQEISAYPPPIDNITSMNGHALQGVPFDGYVSNFGPRPEPRQPSLFRL